MTSAVVLCLVNGPWQALSLVASLRALGLTAPSHRPVALLVDLAEGSPAKSAAESILAAHGIAERHTLPTALRALPGALQAFEQASGIAIARVPCVATYGLHRPAARYIVNGAHDARIVVYEEGLRAYVAERASLRERARIGLAQAWGRVDPVFGRAYRFPRDTGRPVEHALLLSQRIGVPATLDGARIHRVEAVHLESALSGFAAPTVRPLRDAAPHVIIVGQYYARLAQMTREAELDAYAQAAQRIAARGHVPVWRGHLREHDGWLEALQRRCPALRPFHELVEDPRYPLELYADLFRRPDVGAVSFSSSALFYLRHVYGTDTRTLLTPAMLTRMHYPHREGCALAQAHIPPFEA